jgi:glutaminyl-tRNA synthetase
MKFNFAETAAFIHAAVKDDLGDDTARIKTRFPPEPNGYAHIGHARNALLSYLIAEQYGGIFNLRFDDTNPAKEDVKFADALIEDLKWLGINFGEALYASDYFGFFCDCAFELIKAGGAFVCDLTADEMRAYRGTLSEGGRESPYRNRSVDENLDLFTRMKDGEFADGAKTLRAKIDMSSPNVNLRDPVIYRISKVSHYRTKDKWLIYPMYGYSHPLQDLYEGITHSICTLEFEDQRPLYDWSAEQAIKAFPGRFKTKPRQLEAAKLYVSNTVSGKRYIKKLVDNGNVDGWDDPRLITIAGMRRRGYTPEAIGEFCVASGVSKAGGTADFGGLEYFVRNDLKLKSKVVMAVLEPVKVVIENYPEDGMEWFDIELNPENPALGTRKVPFSREIYIERSDFMEDAPNKFFRLKPGGEVRLKGAYFIKCEGVVKDENERITEIRCSYDPETRSGSNFNGRKVKGTIHWVECSNAAAIKANLYDVLVFDDETAEGGKRFNEESLIVKENAAAEPYLKTAEISDRFQFMRNGYFCLDTKALSGELIFNRTVSLKSSYAP